MQDASMCLAGTNAVCSSPGLTHFGQSSMKRRRNNSRQRACCCRRVPLSLPKWSILGARCACKAKVRLWHKTAASPLLRSGSPPIYSSANSLIALALQSKAIGCRQINCFWQEPAADCSESERNRVNYNMSSSCSEVVDNLG